MTPNLDTIILGHNQFFGVAHLSSEKGAQRDQYFSDVKNIIRMIEFSQSLGVSGLMMSTHPRAEAICDLIKKSKLRDEISIYPLLPYIAKYVRQANEKGLTNMVMDALSGASAMQKIGMMLKGGAGLLTKDVFKMMEILIELELLLFKGLKMRAIFLHQALTDLALGLDLKDVFLFYHEFIPKKFGAEAAYCTFNTPMLLEKFKVYGIENPIVMAPFNKAGFQMTRTLPENEKCLRENDLRLVAMSSLAGGYLKPREAYEYLFSNPKIESVVVGASSEAHAKETFETIRSFKKA